MSVLPYCTITLVVINHRTMQQNYQILTTITERMQSAGWLLPELLHVNSLPQSAMLV